VTEYSEVKCTGCKATFFVTADKPRGVCGLCGTLSYISSYKGSEEVVKVVNLTTKKEKTCDCSKDKFNFMSHEKWCDMYESVNQIKE